MADGDTVDDAGGGVASRKQSSEAEQRLTNGDSKVGPLFSVANGCAYVKVSERDAKRPVLDLTTLGLVKYVESSEYVSEPLRSDEGLFVPIFCADCYGTTENDYAKASSNVAQGESEAFLVGACCVYGFASDEKYPESKKVYAVDNELAFSGACHAKPGTALFMHKRDREIGRVRCYWHVHSRSAAKTFLYACVAVNNTPYAHGVVEADINKGFSLGTVGDNKSGPLTEECSLVSLPARPGCYCVKTSKIDCAATMKRLGFSLVKNEALNASESDAIAPDAADTVNELMNSLTGFVESLKGIMAEQATEASVLKDVLNALKVQNGMLARFVNDPNDRDVRFTIDGAKDFTRRTGVRTKLNASVKPIHDADSRDGSDSTSAAEKRNGDATCDGGGSSSGETTSDSNMALTQQHVEELVKILQQHAHGQPQSQPMHNAMQMASMLQLIADPKIRDVLNVHYGNVPSSSSQRANAHQPFDVTTLSEEQRRKIATEYNREENERRAESQQRYATMADSIKSSIRDMLTEFRGQNDDPEQPKRSVAREQQQQQQQQQQHYDALGAIARDVPYKRTAKRTQDAFGDSDVSKVVLELRELTKTLAKRNESDRDAQARVAETSASQAETCDDVETRLQAGCTTEDAMQVDGGPTTETSSLSDFVSAVVGRRAQDPSV